ncbi:hypothetical protein [Micromonospora sp. DT227]|uniref:hypothetical protein n=1 Tax=Micromonospora sp. DT227 TaxID=3393433 RepID=UPI003CF01C46
MGVRALSREERATALQRAGRVVAAVNGGKPQCIERVALLDRVADLLHVRVEPVPVAVAVQGPAGSCLLGEAVNGVIPLLPGGSALRSPSTALWDGAGHLFLFAPQQGIFLDPTLDQVSAATGYPRGCLIMPVTADLLYSEDLTFEVAGSVTVLYRVVRADTTWRTAYNGQCARLGRTARTVARRALELEGFDEDLIAE